MSEQKAGRPGCPHERTYSYSTTDAHGVVTSGLRKCLDCPAVLARSSSTENLAEEVSRLRAENADIRKDNSRDLELAEMWRKKCVALQAELERQNSEWLASTDDAD